VQELERRLGTALFMRTNRQVLLTAAGEELFRLAENTLRTHDGSLQHFQRFLSGEQGAVRVVALPSIVAQVMPAFIRQFKTLNPAVRLGVTDLLSAEVISAVRDGEADIGVTAVDTVPEGLEEVLWSEDPFVALVPPEGSRATRGSLTWRRLAESPFVALDTSSSVREKTDAAFDATGIEPDVVVEVRNISVVGALVSAGVGASAVPELAVPLLSYAPLVVRPLTGPKVTRQIKIITSSLRTLPPAAASFLDALLAGPTPSLKMHH
jgi:DNA-binding transcriptional LysR family regulator